ncbi:MAG: hypothetical protein ACJ8LM_09430, partial [Candidatus Udaeobacter sp.]
AEIGDRFDAEVIMTGADVIERQDKRMLATELLDDPKLKKFGAKKHVAFVSRLRYLARDLWNRGKGMLITDDLSTKLRKGFRREPIHDVLQFEDVFETLSRWRWSRAGK